MVTRAVKADALPAPGLVLGRYPERQMPTPPSAFSRAVTALLRPRADAGERRRHAFVVAVRKQLAAGDAQVPLHQRIARVRGQLARDGLQDAALAEAFALVSLACRDALGQEPYDTQLFAARILLDGQLAEMATGEGKTLAAAVAAATAALAGIPVHVLTANDYLVARDADSLRPLYAALGLSVGAVVQPMPAAARRDAYACDITYCTAKELVFDYLRDGVSAPRVSTLEQRAAALAAAPVPPRLLRGLCMAIIDEADSILIDEARVPLVLSQAVPDNGGAALRHAWTISASLAAGRDFALDAAVRQVRLTASGRERLSGLFADGGIAWLNARHRDDLVCLALTARHALQAGRDYVVDGGRVHIVDGTTGRRAAGRSWSQGLHQLVELKSGCAPTPPVATLARLTYQRFFPRYLRLAGMSGTLTESRAELMRIYGLAVARVPLRKPCRRETWPARVFDSAQTMWPAVAARVRELHAQQRPVLVGTDSVIDTQALSRHLTAAGLAHVLLDASQDQHEAQVVAAAGRAGAITVATQMAGRGTDIVLDDAARAADGLHVICCQQNSSRRIDRQLMGRSARQGDPGSVEYCIALDGPLMAQYRVASLLKKLFKNIYLHSNHAGMAGLRVAQQAAAARARRERALLMRRDQQVDDWFAFSGKEQ